MEKFCFLFWLSFSCLAYSETRYVVKDNPNAVSPYTTWSNAAGTIQDAVNVASPHDTIWVTNGVYDTGGRTVGGALANRVVIDKPLVVKSVNGPAVTIIEGAGPIGDAAIRCVYLGSNAALIGFTLTNGHTRIFDGRVDYQPVLLWGGGVFCEPSAVLSNCVLTGNSADSDGGGAYNGTLNDCALTGNSVLLSGGGACQSVLNNCTLSNNWADRGGGAYNSTLNNCRLSGNSAGFFGGGVAWCTLNNCALSGNKASYGGGSSDGTLNNCTLSGNRASYGGGSCHDTLNNCIVYHNEATSGPNFQDSTFNYSCTTPNPGGLGNISSEPMLASASHLAMGSPCMGAGNGIYATGTDIDGEAWRPCPSMGCDEALAGAITGALSVSAWASYTNATTGFSIRFTADIQGRTTASSWNFGDGTVLSNKPYAAHTFSSNGVYAVWLRAFNESYPLGIATTVTVQMSAQTVHYVNIGNATPATPHTSWETAATNIQDAVDVATQAGDLVLVSNGVYASGGRVVYDSLTNRIAITKPVIIRSVNGPEVTLIEGAGPEGDAAVRCVYLGTNAALIGFTLTNGHTRASFDSDNDKKGGGVFCEPWAVLSNCVLTGNSAHSDGGGAYDGTFYNCALIGNSAYNAGGGVFWGMLYNCALTSNSAGWRGGGAYEGSLNNCMLTGNSANGGGGACGGFLCNCTLTGNSAGYYGGGGTYYGTLYNCIVYYNPSPTSSYNSTMSTMNYCCAPDASGEGHITNEPVFVDYEGGNLRLQSNSPCVNTGINQDWMAGSTDLDGNPRVRRGRVDMGAYESDHWGQFSDVDADGLSDWIEVYRTGTDPTNAASYLGMGIPFYSDSVDMGLVVRWQSVADKTYRLARTTNLMEDFVSFSNRLNATPPMNTYTDETAIGWGPWYYRVGVE